MRLYRVHGLPEVGREQYHQRSARCTDRCHGCPVETTVHGTIIEGLAIGPARDKPSAERSFLKASHRIQITGGQFEIVDPEWGWHGVRLSGVIEPEVYSSVSAFPSVSQTVRLSDRKVKRQIGNVFQPFAVHHDGQHFLRISHAQCSQCRLKLV